MKNKYLILSLILSFNLLSCSNNDYVDKYTVIWQNYDGTILKILHNVNEGECPIYDGVTPVRKGEDKYSYTFKEFYPLEDKIVANTTYTATFDKNINTYVVTWVNDDGSVLEIDEGVPYGSYPSYDGEIPTKKDDEEYIYTFVSFTPNLSIVTEDITYKAIYSKRKKGDIDANLKPTVSSDNKYIEYGYYPQEVVDDDNLILQLDNLNKDESMPYYFYNDNYYYKEVTSLYHNSNGIFLNGKEAINNHAYWFKCEKIKWNILSKNENTYFLATSSLLDVCNFYKDYEIRNINGIDVYPNNYEYSDVRSYLNNEFYNLAFALNDDYILINNVDNKGNVDANDNIYSSNNTLDKVYLLSYQDYLNENYGFDKINDISSSRTLKVTDYGIAKGAYVNLENDYKYNSIYLTRTPSNKYNYSSYVINTSGYLSEYVVDSLFCIRPCIKIVL